MSDLFPSVRRRMPDGSFRHGHEIVCAICGVDDFLTTKAAPWPETQVSAHFQHRGWLVNSKGRHQCRECQKKERSNARAARELSRASSQESVMKSPAPSQPMSDAFVDVVLLIKDHYDPKQKNYRAGWSDARIARDTGVSEKVVTDTREQRFGPLEADTFLADMRAAFVAIGADRQAAVALGERIAAAQAETMQILAAIRERQAAAIALIDARVAAAK